MGKLVLAGGWVRLIRIHCLTCPTTADVLQQGRSAAAALAVWEREGWIADARGQWRCPTCAQESPPEGRAAEDQATALVHRFAEWLESDGALLPTESAPSVVQRFLLAQSTEMPQ